MSKELVQYRHHIVSAKEIGKVLLQGVPDTSPFHRSITAVQETPYYINSVGRAVHPSNDSSFLVNRSSFFSGAPEYEPPTKVRIVSSKKPMVQLQSEHQHSHLKIPKPKASLMKVCPQHQDLNNSSQEVGSVIFLPQLNIVPPV